MKGEERIRSSNRNLVHQGQSDGVDTLVGRHESMGRVHVHSRDTKEAGAGS